jgi:hypothetical protein
MKPYRWQYFLGVIYTLLQAVAVSVGPYLIGQALVLYRHDRAAVGDDLRTS